MSKKKKITYNELMERNDFLLSRLMEIERAVNYTHSLIIAYIDCNEDQDKLKKESLILQEKLNKVPLPIYIG